MWHTVLWLCLTSAAVWSAPVCSVFPSVLSCHGDGWLRHAINRQTSRAFIEAEHEGSPLVLSSFFLCVWKQPLEALAYKASVANTTVPASVQELLLGGLEIRNSILGSGQPEAEGFASSAQLQAAFCKTGTSPQGFSSVGKCHYWCLCILSKQRQCHSTGGVCVLRAEVGTTTQPLFLSMPHELLKSSSCMKCVPEHGTEKFLSKGSGKDAPCVPADHVIAEGLQLKAAARACAFVWDDPWGAEWVFDEKIKPELEQGKDERINLEVGAPPIKSSLMSAGLG